MSTCLIRDREQFLSYIGDIRESIICMLYDIHRIYLHSTELSDNEIVHKHLFEVLKSMDVMSVLINNLIDGTNNNPRKV